MGDIVLREEQAPLPTIVDLRAASEPDRLYGATSWIDSNGKVQLRKLTFQDVAAAVNRGAHWMHQLFGTSVDFKALAYLGPADYRYNIITMAAAKIGHKAVLLSPWNSELAQIKVLNECNCKTVLIAEDDVNAYQNWKPMATRYDLELYRSPTLQWLLDGPPTPSYHIQGSLAELHDKDYVVIHTSGSTGYPKAWPYKYGAIASQRYLVSPQNILPNPSKGVMHDVWKDKCYLLAFPPSHMGGTLGLGPFNIYWNMPMILPPAEKKADADIVAQILSHDLCEAAFLAPALLHALTRDTDRVEALGKVKHILWAGASMTSENVSDEVKKRTILECGYGSTETGPLLFVTEPDHSHEWRHFHELMGVQMRHFGDDLYEAVIVRDPGIVAAQFIFQNCPHLTEWPTKDLWSKHPEHDHLWQYRGRLDDIIPLSIGRSIEPSLMENAVNAHAKVKSALLCGSQKPRTSLLIEPCEPPKSAEEETILLEDLWPTIESANQTLNRYGRIDKGMVIFARPEKPFHRAGKGSVQRHLTVQNYSEEIDALYGV